MKISKTPCGPLCSCWWPLENLEELDPKEKWGVCLTDKGIERWPLRAGIDYSVWREPLDMGNADRIDGYDRDDLGESPDY